MSGIIKAVLGPTNTGKTHYAIERMLAYSSGVMGFPLRLLAREVYDRVVAIKGEHQVGLVTGEEQIIPEGARYILATVEAMPRHRSVDFVAIDEIQMAADPDRGHVFTDHLLHSRGRSETLFLGAATMAGLIRKLVPEAEIVDRPRYSDLSYVRPAKLHRLPRRSAIVTFSVQDVYALAELIRRDKGGAAIVMGALSPRTRNAQVAMYQAGEVDYMIATDAIGMGLNLDVGHVAFAGTAKFDGRHYRPLTSAELGQIAGRAGRYKTDGSFSTLSGGLEPLEDGVVEQIEEHRFDPVKIAHWRNSRLDFNTPHRLLQSLEKRTDTDGLSRQRDSLDVQILKALMADEDIMHMTRSRDQVQQLWAICQVPDFKALGLNDHVGLLKRLYADLCHDHGVIDEDLISRQVKRLDKPHGDIDTLAARIAAIRVWTYISHRRGWLADHAHWAAETRRVEDSLSDALHDKLTQRFVDRRTAVLMRGLKQRGGLSVQIDKTTGDVTAEDHKIGVLRGFSFEADITAAADEQKTLNAAATEGLRGEISRRAKLFANVGFKAIELDLSRGIQAPRLAWEGNSFARLRSVASQFKLEVVLEEGHMLLEDEAALVTRKAQEWLDARIAEKLEPILKLNAELNGEIEAPEGAAPLSGLARGIAFRLIEAYGTLERRDIDSDLRQLDQEARKGLRRFGVRFGATSLYMPLLLKPHATELRLILWALNNDADSLPALPTPGMVWVELAPQSETDKQPLSPQAETFYTLAGFRLTRAKAVRMDMVERLADAVRPLGGQGNWFPVTPEIMGLVGLSGDDFAAVMESLGYKSETRKEAKQAAETAAPATAEITAETDAVPETETSAEAADTADTSSTAETPPAQADAADAPAQTPDATAEAVEGVEIKADVSEEAESGDASETTADTADTADATAEELIDRLYFQWAPKRKRQSGRRDGRSQNRHNDAGGDKTGGKAGSQKRGKGRFDGKFSQSPKGKGPKGGKDAGGNKPANRSGGKGPRPERQPDPDSPFAALAGLKESLSKK